MDNYAVIVNYRRFPALNFCVRITGVIAVILDLKLKKNEMSTSLANATLIDQRLKCAMTYLLTLRIVFHNQGATAFEICKYKKSERKNGRTPKWLVLPRKNGYFFSLSLSHSIASDPRKR